MTTKTALIADFDLTLADTKVDILLSLTQTLREITGKEIKPKELAPYIGIGLQPTMDKFMPGVKVGSPEFMQMMFHYQGIYKTKCHVNTRPFSGVIETLETLRAKGIKIGVASNKYGAIAAHVAKSIQMDHLLDHVHGTEKLIGKPDPGVINACMEHLAVKPENVVYVGDRTVDVIAGKAAGCLTVAVTYGADDVATLKEHEPDAIIDRFDELLRFFE